VNDRASMPVAPSLSLELNTRPIRAEREPVITSERAPRFVAHASCSLCGVRDLGVEFHGELMSGAKIHQLAAHSPDKRSVQRGQPRCLGSGARVQFVGGHWRIAERHRVMP